MEVSGQKNITYSDEKLCNFCEDYDITTSSDGFCLQCEVHLCKNCFDKHKRRKNNRDHSLVNITNLESFVSGVENTFELCEQHSGELVRFYCQKHDQVGCGECIVVYHNGCKLELIRDKAYAFIDGQEFKTLSEGIQECKEHAKNISSSIENNKQTLSDLYNKFVNDVEKFADKLIERINKMKVSTLSHGSNIMLNDKKKIDDIQKDNESVLADMSRLENILEFKKDHPNELFIAAVQVKPEFEKRRQEIDILREKNVVTQYSFQQDQILEETMEEKKMIGLLQKQPEANSIESASGKGKETAPERRATPVVRTPELPKQQPLLDRKLVCKNLNIDGYVISYSEKEADNIGIFVDKNYLRTGDTIEIEVLSVDKRSSIAIGVVPDDYSVGLLPGNSEFSIGYYSDGKMYNGSTTDIKHGEPWRVGDKISIKIRSLKAVAEIFAVVQWQQGFGPDMELLFDGLYLTFNFNSSTVVSWDRVIKSKCKVSFEK